MRGTSRPSASRRKAATQPTYGESPDMDDDMSMDEEDLAAADLSMNAAAGGGSKKFETEEEKRKNFLERNRQG